MKTSNSSRILIGIKMYGYSGINIVIAAKDLSPPGEVSLVPADPTL